MATNKIKNSGPLPSISVIIPTIGRHSLISALESVVSQTYPACEILIICDESLSNNKYINQASKYFNVRILHNASGTVSKNRNQGILSAHGDFVAFLDDDDLWHSEKLRLQSEKIRDSSFDVICSRATYEGWKSKIGPNKVFKNDELFILSLYDNWNFSSRRFGVPTPTLVVSTALAKQVLFDESLNEREDIWFVHRLQCAGAKIFQLEDALVTISHTKPHTNRKVFVEQEIQWFRRLNLISRNLGWKFLLTISIRNCLVNFKVKTALSLSLEAIKSNRSVN